MKRIIRLICIMALVMLVAGCGKKTPQKSEPVTEVPTEPVTEAPTPEVKKDKAVSLPISYGQGDGGWICQGMLTLDTEGGQPSYTDNGVDTFAGKILEYRVENSAHKELFRIVSAKSETDYVYTLKIGAYERRLTAVPEGESTVSLFRYPDRLVIRQNGMDLLNISADAGAMTISNADEKQDVWAFRFPVRNGVVSETDASGLLYLAEDTLTAKITSLRDLYDGAYLYTIEERIRSGVGTKEHDGEYVQVTKKRVIENLASQEYNAIYQSNTVIVDRRTVSGKVVEYEFRELSNGISSVAYFASTTGDDKPDFLFEVELLDEFRSREYEKEEAEERALASYREGCIPFRIVPTDFGFIERGIKKADETEEDYVRLCFCDGVAEGNVYAIYQNGNAVSVLVDKLAGADGRLYAKGTITRGDKAVRDLQEFTYDEYGVLVKETRPGYTASYEYAFSDFAYGGADDTIRHEWQKLMPYLEAYPMESQQGAE